MKMDNDVLQLPDDIFYRLGVRVKDPMRHMNLIPVILEETVIESEERIDLFPVILTKKEFKELQKQDIMREFYNLING